tara:strand:- start:454 stop:612 length:159 start_codon:yes stop_codon:yes gene_type:complete
VEEIIARLESALDEAAKDDLGSRTCGAVLLVSAGEALGLLRLIKEQFDAKAK